MKFITTKLTSTPKSKTDSTFKIYNDKIYYMWNERDINDVGQVWFGVSELDGSDFTKTQITNGAIYSMDRPKLYIYNDVVYATWHGVTEVSGRYQVFIISMNLDSSNFNTLYTTNYIDGAINSEIVVKNDIIYLGYLQGRYTSTRYKHMIRAKLNINGTNFFESAYSTSANETSHNIKIFVVDDDDDIYYMWTRYYFIDAPPKLYLYVASSDLSTFTYIKQMNRTAPSNLYINDGKIYFTWRPYTGGKGQCSVINTDGSEYSDILNSDTYYYSLLQVTSEIPGNDVIDFTITNQTSSAFPIKIFQFLSASLDVSTSAYTEEELLNDIEIGFNDTPNMQSAKNDGTMYYVWKQYDENNKYQIWLGILGDKNAIDKTKDNTLLYILGGTALYLLGNKKKITLMEYMNLNK